MKKITILPILLFLPLTAYGIDEDVCGVTLSQYEYRGDFIANHDLVPTTPSADFEVVYGELGVIRHLKTGLEWQRCFVGETWNDITQSCDGEPTIYGDYLGLAILHVLQSEGWRIPNAKEASSIVERCKRNPALNTQVFPSDVLGSSESGYTSFETLTSTLYSDFYQGHWISISIRSGHEIIRHYENSIHSAEIVMRLVRGPEQTGPD